MHYYPRPAFIPARYSLHFLSSEDGQTILSLVEKMCNQHATLFTMVARMEATGMVKKEKDALDKEYQEYISLKKDVKPMK